MDSNYKAFETSNTTTGNELFEEDILIETVGVLKYFLSNDINKIQDAIYNRTGNNDFSFIDEYRWELNHALSNKVKELMNKYNVNYSMTYYSYEGKNILVINKREGNKWFFAGHEDINNSKILLTPKDKLGYAEEYIIVEEENKKANHIFKYSLTDSLEDIKIAIYSRTGYNVNIDKAYWRMNSQISANVKYLMNKHKVRFSITEYYNDKCNTISIIMRVGDLWFQTLYVDLKGKLHSFQSHFDYLCKRYFSENVDDEEE